MRGWYDVTATRRFHSSGQRIASCSLLDLKSSPHLPREFEVVFRGQSGPHRMHHFPPYSIEGMQITQCGSFIVQITHNFLSDQIPVSVEYVREIDDVCVFVCMGSRIIVLFSSLDQLLPHIYGKAFAPPSIFVLSKLFLQRFPDSHMQSDFDD